jgi:carbonic anhydrase
MTESYYGAELHRVRKAVKVLLEYNAQHMQRHENDHFQAFMERQTPRATVLACSDSRVQMHAIDPFPENDLFVVRNIGNQLATAEGSIEYGVRHLHTPILMVLGHVRCGAIGAAHGGHADESDAIRRELETLHVDKSRGLLENVIDNVRRQVNEALKKFDSEVRREELLIAGAVYDFANDFNCGHGKLIFTDLNNIRIVENNQVEISLHDESLLALIDRLEETQKEA